MAPAHPQDILSAVRLRRTRQGEQRTKRREFWSARSSSSRQTYPGLAVAWKLAARRTRVARGDAVLAVAYLGTDRRRRATRVDAKRTFLAVPHPCARCPLCAGSCAETQALVCDAVVGRHEARHSRAYAVLLDQRARRAANLPNLVPLPIVLNHVAGL